MTNHHRASHANNIPVQSPWGAYLLFSLGFHRRVCTSMKNDSHRGCCSIVQIQIHDFYTPQEVNNPENPIPYFLFLPLLDAP